MEILFFAIFILGILWIGEKILSALFGVNWRKPPEDKNRTSSWRKK